LKNFGTAFVECLEVLVVVLVVVVVVVFIVTSATADVPVGTVTYDLSTHLLAGGCI
jgi:hypothetical protein